MLQKMQAFSEELASSFSCQCNQKSSCLLPSSVSKARYDWFMQITHSIQWLWRKCLRENHKVHRHYSVRVTMHMTTLRILEAHGMQNPWLGGTKIYMLRCKAEIESSKCGTWTFPLLFSFIVHTNVPVARTKYDQNISWVPVTVEIHLANPCVFEVPELICSWCHWLTRNFDVFSIQCNIFNNLLNG